MKTGKKNTKTTKPHSREEPHHPVKGAPELTIPAAKDLPVWVAFPRYQAGRIAPISPSFIPFI